MSIDVFSEYVKQLELLKEKFPARKIDLSDDGQIVIKLLRKGYDAASLEMAVKKHSPVSTEHAQALIDQCKEAVKAYEKISSYAGDSTNPIDGMYYSLAQELLRNNPCPLLKIGHDQKIILQMRSNGVMLEDLDSVLIRLSPVAKEPGRNMKRYAETVLKQVENEYQLKLKNVIEVPAKYSFVSTAYNDKINNIEKGIQRRIEELTNQLDKDRVFFDGRVARELLEAKHDTENVIKAIAENSPQAKNGLEYSGEIVKAVKNEIAAEKAILGFTAAQAAAGELTLGDIYRLIVKNQVEENPKLAKELNAEFVDHDVASIMLNQEYSPGDIIEAIKNASPRAMMPGLPNDYVERVVEAELAYSREPVSMDAEIEATKQRYLEQCGLVLEGREGAEDTFNSYHDCRAAVNMLSEGWDRTFVQNTIAETSPYLKECNCLSDPYACYQYSSKVVTVAQTVLERRATIERLPLNSVDSYQKRLQARIKEKDVLSFRVDMEIAKSLLRDGFKAVEIAKDIALYSPVAVEMGRNKNYSDLVCSKASEQLGVEQQKGLSKADKSISNKATEPAGRTLQIDKEE